MRDIVCPVRPGDLNDELRFSLRTLEANFPQHGDIWIVGYLPNWLTNVHHIPGNGYRGNRNVYRNILAAAEHPDTPDEFYVWNDDFLLTAPIADIPVYYHSKLADQIAPIKKRPGTWWHRSLIFTHKVLQRAGYEDPLSYELHLPLPVHKQGMADALRRFLDEDENGIPPQWRTLYGVVNDIGGTQHSDTKARGRSPVLEPFLSTTDSTFRYFRNYFQMHYPQPSRYEKVN